MDRRGKSGPVTEDILGSRNIFPVYIKAGEFMKDRVISNFARKLRKTQSVIRRQRTFKWKLLPRYFPLCLSYSAKPAQKRHNKVI